MRSTRRRLSALAVFALVAGSVLVVAPAHAQINYITAKPPAYVSNQHVTVEVDFEDAPVGTPWVTINGDPVAAVFTLYPDFPEYYQYYYVSFDLVPGNNHVQIGDNFNSQEFWTVYDMVPPTVELVTPSSITVPRGSEVTVSANVSDDGYGSWTIAHDDADSANAVLASGFLPSNPSLQSTVIPIDSGWADGDHTVVVKAVDQAGNVTSVPVTITVAGTALDAPTPFTTGEFWTVDSLSWSAVDDADHYEVRYGMGTGSLVGITPTSVDGTTFEPDLMSGEWQYQVRAIDGDDYPGAWSAPAFVTVIGAPELDTYCGVVLFCNLFGDELSVDWSDAPTSNLRRYEFQYTYLGDLRDAGDDQVFTKNVTTGSSLDLDVPNNRPDGYYEIKVRAISRTAIAPGPTTVGPWSEPSYYYRSTKRLTAPTLVTPDPTTTPVITGDHVTLTWSDLPEAFVWEVRIGDPDSVKPDSGNLVGAESHWLLSDSAVDQLSLFLGGTGPDEFTCEMFVESLSIGGGPFDPEEFGEVGCGNSLDLSGLAPGDYGWQAHAIDLPTLFFLLGGFGPCGCTTTDGPVQGKWSDVGVFTMKAAPLPSTGGTTHHHTSTGPTETATPTPTPTPTVEPTDEPTAEPSDEPTDEPTTEPTAEADDPVDAFPVGWVIGGIVLLVLLAGGGFLIFFLRRP